MLKVTKKELAEALAEEYGYSKKESLELVNSLFGKIVATLAEGNTVDISGFGKFVVKERAAREGINPATGDKVEIPASKAPAFRAAKALKEAVK
ncbi:MAG: HU family DNA-binding protein [Erysipelotrichaceae bacterium]|nr:HU family DNA-binding protein [Erysipelotrichaceae bacterium]